MKKALLLLTFFLSVFANAQKAAFYHSKPCTGQLSFFDTSAHSGGQIIAWKWSVNDSVFSTSQNPVLNLSQAGTYEIKLVVLTFDAKRDSLTKSVHVYKTPDFILGVDVVEGCMPLAVTMQVLLGMTDSGLTKLWDFNSDGITDSSAGNKIKYHYTSDGAYKLSLTIDNHGCAVSDTESVWVYPLPDATIKRRGDTLFASGAGNYNHTWKRNNMSLGSFDTFHVITQPGLYTVYVQNIYGCAAVGAFSVFPLSVKNFDTEFKLYPNPTNGVFEIQVPSGTASKRLFNSLGQEFEFDFRQEADVLHADISALPAGLYILQIESSGMIYSLKLMKE